MVNSDWRPPGQVDLILKQRALPEHSRGWPRVGAKEQTLNHWVCEHVRFEFSQILHSKVLGGPLVPLGGLLPEFSSSGIEEFNGVVVCFDNTTVPLQTERLSTAALEGLRADIMATATLGEQQTIMGHCHAALCIALSRLTGLKTETTFHARGEHCLVESVSFAPIDAYLCFNGPMIGAHKTGHSRESTAA